MCQKFINLVLGIFISLSELLIATVALAADNLPTYDPITGNLTLPNVIVEGQAFGQAQLQHDGDGVFSLVVMPTPIVSTTIKSAANYTNGILNIASVMVAEHRYANARLRHGLNGKFVLESIKNPLTVFSTSYENKNLIPFDETTVPTLRALGIQKTIPTETDSVDRSIAFGDFFQEGKYSAFVMASNSDGVWGVGISNIPGLGYFLAQDSNGKWINRSGELFRSMSDRMGCISPSYTAVADFNNDGRPDVYVACNGFDFVIPNATVEQNIAVTRSFQMLYLSQLDGTYKAKQIEEEHPLYGHKAVALDMNSDSNADIVTVDPFDPTQPLGCGAPYVLLGNGDGTFKRDNSFIDQDMLRKKLQFCGMFNVDVIPIEGRQDLMVAGQINDVNERGSHVVLWAKGIKNGFDIANAKILTMPMDPVTSSQFQFPLDIIYDAKTASLYMKSTGTTHDKGTSWSILKFDKNGNFVRLLHSWLNLTTNFQPTSPQFKPAFLKEGFLLPFTGGCARDITKGACGQVVPME